MIIRFFVENYLSFDERIEFSMIPGRARSHPGHVVRDEAWDGINLLRSAVLYGANGAGKSNLVKSLSFMQNLILNGTEPGRQIDLQRFKLSHDSATRPARFEIEMKIGRQYFAYGFEITPGMVLSEWLYEIRKDRQEMLYERSTENDEAVLEFGRNIAENKKDAQFLEFVGKATRPEQLFLTESRRHNVKQFKHILDWFRTSLKIVFPDSTYRDLEIEMLSDEQVQRKVVAFLDHFHTGITNIDFKPVDYSSDLLFPEELRTSIESELDKASTMVLRSMGSGGRYLVKKNAAGVIEAARMVAQHKLKDSERLVDLEIEHESDGTKRLLDLIPALLALSGGERVFVIDELDRSLHPVLSREILEYFLEQAQGVNQLIVTTHESSLLDLNLLRRDEIWFVEKDRGGASRLYSLEEFAPRYDRDIRRGYLQGRFGSIPVLGEPAGLYRTGNNQGEENAGET